MIRFLSSLASLGRLLIDAGGDTSTAVLDSYYLCEITEQKILFTYHKEPLTVPERLAKASDLKPNYLDENLKYFMGTKNLKGKDPFWDLCTKTLKDAGEVKILAAVVEFRERLKKYSATPVFSGTTKERFYFVTKKGAAFPKLNAKPSRKNMESLGVMSDSVTIIMTYNGKPITGTPKTMAWWRKQCSNVSDLLDDGVDIVKGEPCHVSRLIDRVSTLDAPMVSFQKGSSFTLGKLSQANNFPVSKSTKDEFNAGMLWITRKNGGQFAIISKVGPSRLAAGWWVEGCIDHPILKPLTAILRGADAEMVEDAWTTLALMQQEGFTQQVNFAAWRYSKSRFALLDQWEVSANELITNLLKFHSEFGHIKEDGHSSYDPVCWTITLKGDNKQPIVPPSCFFQCFKAVTTGSNYPDQIASYYFNNSFKWATSDGSIHPWLNAYFSRKINMAIKFPLTKHTSKVQYNIDSPHPELRDFVGEAEGSLTGVLLTEYRVGLVLALCGKIKQLYHICTSDKFFPIGLPNNFKMFMRREIGMLSKYQGCLEAKGSGSIFNIVNGYLNEYIKQITPTILTNYNRQSEYTNFGWMHGCAYFKELSNWNKTTRDLIAEARK